MTNNAGSLWRRYLDCSWMCQCCFSSGEESQQPGNNRKQETNPPVQEQPLPTSVKNTQRETDRLVEKQPRSTSSKFPDETNCSFEEKWKTLKKTMEGSSQMKKLKVGVFSRAAESEYQWLRSRLESEHFQGIVSEVRPCPITNDGVQQFYEDLSQCTYGILYHSKNRGRINLTNVTDSLYDVELEYLSKNLKKKNVIVVIDDLTDSSQEEKDRILGAQPSLKEWAKEVFLFSIAEKK